MHRKAKMHLWKKKWPRSIEGLHICLVNQDPRVVT